jgi:hypothetical protein
MPGRNFYPKEILIGGINVLVVLFLAEWFDTPP